MRHRTTVVSASVPPVKPHNLVGTAIVPGHGGEMRCVEHDGDFKIYVDGLELMSTRVFGSEQALAELAIEHVGRDRVQRVLVGGLGMGFTLARVLARVGPGAIVDVVELVSEVVQWNRELFGHCAEHPLRDARTKLVVGDVGAHLASRQGAYDVVLLDVDNGPEGLSRPTNDALYTGRGIKRARAALREGGALAIWSAEDSPQFEHLLRQAGWLVKRHRVRARLEKGPKRTIWVASRP